MRDKIVYKGFEIVNKEKVERIAKEIEEDLSCLRDGELRELKEATGMEDLTDIISNHTYEYFEKTFGKDSRITFYTWLAKHDFNANVVNEMCNELQKIANSKNDKVKVVWDDIDKEDDKLNIKIGISNRLIMEDDTKKRSFSTYKHLKRIFMKVIEEHKKNE